MVEADLPIECETAQSIGEIIAAAGKRDHDIQPALQIAACQLRITVGARVGAGDPVPAVSCIHCDRKLACGKVDQYPAQGRFCLGRDRLG